MWETGDGQGAEAGMAVISFAFKPRLGGREVAIDSPEQCGPLQSLL